MPRAISRGGQDGWYPGLAADGSVLPDGPQTGHSGDGTVPAARLWILLDQGSIAPQMLYSLTDPDTTPLPLSGSTYPALTPDHFGYAMLGLTGSPEVKADWSESINNSAVVLADRAIGTGPGDISSVWTTPGSGQWSGTAWYATTAAPVMNRPADGYATQYGQGSPNTNDHLFVDDPAADDAVLVHENATTSFSSQ